MTLPPWIRRSFPCVLCWSLLGLACQAIAHSDPAVSTLADESRALIRQGDVVAALAKLRELEKRSASDPEAKFSLGEILQELAASKAEQLQRLAPDSAAAHELLGKALESQDKLEQALEEYRQASSKNPNAQGLHFLVGNVEWKLRNLEAAKADFAAELKVNPHHAMANLRMGQSLLDMERDNPAAAIPYLQEATSDAPNSLEAHRELGKAFRLAHRYPEAAKELQLVEAKAPEDETIHAQLAALYKATGDSARAREEIKLHAKLLREKLEASEKVHNQTHPHQ